MKSLTKVATKLFDIAFSTYANFPKCVSHKEKMVLTWSISFLWIGEVQEYSELELLTSLCQKIQERAERSHINERLELASSESTVVVF